MCRRPVPFSRFHDPWARGEWPILPRPASPWPLPSAWRRCACGTAGGPRRRFRTVIGRESPACCSSCTCRVPWLSEGVSVHRAAGTLCALDSCSGPVRTPSGLGVCRQLGPRVFPHGRCCRWAGGRGVPASGGPLVPTVGFWCSILAGTGCFGAVPFALGSARQGKRELESMAYCPLVRLHDSTGGYPDRPRYIPIRGGVRQHFGFALYVL